jgi:DUF4097 and DUF4098 domain-containing protein YvlB
MTLDTSGGSIRVGAALTTLDADTSGGGITVSYVGPTARTVALETSGGTIRVGVDSEAALTIDASTSGGHVEVEGLPIATDEQNRSKLKGSINGGGGQLRAATSGGSIKLTRSDSPNEAELESNWD